MLRRAPGSHCGSRAAFFGVAALPIVLGGCGAPERQPAEEAYLPLIVQLEAAPTVSSGSPIFNDCRLTLDRRIGGEDDFGYVWGLFPLSDAYLLASDTYSDPRMKVVDRSDGRIVQAFGKKGRGPLEFETPLSMYWSAARPGALEIYDQVNRRFSRFSFDAPSGTVTFLDESPFYAAERISSLAPLDDGYIGSGIFAYHTLVTFDSDGRLRSRLATLPPFLPKDTGGSARLSRLYNEGHMDVAGHRAAVVYWSRPYVDLVDLEAHRYLRVIGPRHTEPVFEIVDGRLFPDHARSTDAYKDVVVSDRLVYAVFDGEHRDGLGKFLHVFTWDGRFVVEYELDHRITVARIGPDERVLWAGFEDPYPRIGEWTLPPLHEALDRVERGEAPGDIHLCSD